MNVASLLLFAALQPHAAPVPPCTAENVAVTFHAAEGEFTGMSHSGTWMTLRNTGKRACTIPRRPAVSFVDAAGKPVTARLNVPPGMHPGPVLVPIVLRPGKSAQGSLRWVSGEVFDTSLCADVARAQVTLGDRQVPSELRARMCGDATTGIQYDEQWMQPVR